MIFLTHGRAGRELDGVFSSRLPRPRLSHNNGWNSMTLIYAFNNRESGRIIRVTVSSKTETSSVGVIDGRYKRLGQ